MFIYTIPYYDQEDEKIYVQTIFSKEEKPLIPLLHTFLNEIDHGYLDEDYTAYSTEKTLEIAAKDYQISRITIQQIENENLYTGSYYVDDLVKQLNYFHFRFQTLTTQQEILLSTQILYQQDIYSDDVHFLVDGVERFLFEFYTKEDEEEDFKDYLKEDGYSYKDFDSGLVIPDVLEIDAPIQKEEEILDVFKKWAAQIGIDLSGKNIRLAKEEEFEARPFFDSLTKQLNEDKEFSFCIPSHLAFFLQDEIPSFEELLPLLEKETEETIACVIDDFSDAFIQKVLDALPEKKETIMHRFIQIPSSTFEERLRFIDLFEKEFDLSYVKDRINILNGMACVKNPDLENPYSQYLEYCAWGVLLQRQSKKTEG